MGKLFSFIGGAIMAGFGSIIALMFFISLGWTLYGKITCLGPGCHPITWVEIVGDIAVSILVVLLCGVLIKNGLRHFRNGMAKKAIKIDPQLKSEEEEYHEF